MTPRWENIKNRILGKKFDLSVVFADGRLLKKFNTIYRKKKETTNVLSFPLSSDQGEIFINKELAKKEAKQAGILSKDYLDYLFIHSLLHLKGFKHGKKMETAEDKFIKKFKIPVF